MDGLGSKWTVQGSETGRPKRLKVGGLGPKWTVPKGEKLDGLKEGNWTIIRDESRRSKRLEVDGVKD